jgi:hypothetical protein
MSTEHGLRRAIGRGLIVTFALACTVVWAFSSIAPGRAAAQPVRARSRDARSSAASTSVASAASKVRSADHALVASAEALERCKVAERAHRRTHASRCAGKRRTLQRAGARLAAAEHALASRACDCGRDKATAAARRSIPDLKVSGDTLAWSPGDRTGEFVIRRTVSGQAAHYSFVRATTATPPPIPGVEAGYSVRDAARTAAWSAEQRIRYSWPQTGDPQAAPAITVTGEVLSWNVIAGVKTYVLLAKAPGVAAVYSVVAGNTFTPVAVPGVTVEYSVRTAVAGSAWAPVVRISFPAAPAATKEPTEPAEAPPTTGPEGSGERSGSLIAGVVGLVAGPLPEVNTFKSILHTRYMRLDAGNGESGWYSSDMPAFITEVVTKDDVTPLILYNPAEPTKETLVGRPVATVRSEVKALGEVMHGLGLKWMEFGNEEYFYEQPGEYARQYMAAMEGLKGLGITLIANSWGDYWNDEKGASNGYWSDVVGGGGWWVDFVNDVKALGGSLPVACSLHPYGPMAAHEYFGAGGGPSGWMSVPAMHNWMVQKGMAAPIWITEVGQETSGGGAEDVTEEQKASDTRQYVENAESWSYVQGLFIYSTMNSMGQGYGLFSSEGAPTLAASAFGQALTSLGLSSS